MAGGKVKKLCVVTTSRADYGLLFYTLKKIEQDKALKLQLVVSGTHLSGNFGKTVDFITGDGFRPDKLVEIIISSDTHEAIGNSASKAVDGFTQAFSELKPDAILLLGDRYEMLSAAFAAAICIIPAVHFHGGEISEGANDDMFRHAITKLSALHFVSTKEYRKRVIQLGEQPKNVIVSGALGIENIKKLKFLTRKDLEKKLGITFKERIFLVTFHPATMEKSSPEDQVKELIAALSQFENTTFIVTKANADASGLAINKILEEFSEKNKNCYLGSSLGQLNYLSLMSICDMVIGNSSSGIIEAPSCNKPTINIGSRQKGRMKAKSVIDCEPFKNKIEKAIKKALNMKMNRVHNPYDFGMPSEIIIERIKKTDLTSLLPKKFYDLK